MAPTRQEFIDGVKHLRLSALPFYCVCVCVLLSKWKAFLSTWVASSASFLRMRLRAACLPRWGVWWGCCFSNVSDDSVLRLRLGRRRSASE